MTDIPDKELRTAVLDFIFVDGASNPEYTTDKIMALFQAREQQLLTEIMGEKQFVKSDEDFGNKVIEAVPVAVIKQRMAKHD